MTNTDPSTNGRAAGQAAAPENCALVSPGGGAKDRLKRPAACVSQSDSRATEQVGSAADGGFVESSGAGRSDDRRDARPTVPDHELIRRIGGGSYGEVWLARNIMGEYRAVKIIHRRSFDSDRPYEREFEGIRRFEPVSRSHPSQVNILHVGEGEGCFYYVMELGDDAQTQGDDAGWKIADSKSGNADPDHLPSSIRDPRTYIPRTLKSEVARQGRLPAGECLEIGLALTTALDHLHKHGLVHRDVKPSNVIFVNGIPKLADIGLVTGVDVTRSFVGTEGFIPPEGPGTPQADIYGLGKVLYEISTGKDRQDFPDPPTRLGEYADREELVELDEVIQKACASNPRQRYQTAAQMQEDLLLLKAGKSVKRVHGIERRLKITTRVAIAAAAVMVLGVVPYYLAINEAHAAKVAAAKSEQVAAFLKDMLKGVGPSVALGRDTTMLREILDKTAERVGKELKGQPEVEAELRKEIALVYLALGEYGAAEGMDRAALALYRAQFGGAHTNVVEVLNDLGRILFGERKFAEAEASYHEALTIQTNLLGAVHPDVADVLGNLSLAVRDQIRLEEAEAIARAALSIRKKIGAKEDEHLAQSIEVLVGVLLERHRFAEAETLSRQLVSIRRKLSASQPLELATTLDGLAVLLHRQSKLAEAEAASREALEIQGRILGTNHADTAKSLNTLGVVLWAEGRLAEAETTLREALALDRKLDQGVGPPLNNIALVLEAEGKLAEAEAAFRELLALFPDTRPVAYYVLMNLGKNLLIQGKLAEAEAITREALAAVRKVDGNEGPILAHPLTTLAQVLRDQGKLDEAETACRQGLAIRQKAFGDNNADVATSLFFLASVLQRQGRLAEAESSARQCTAIREDKIPDDWQLFNARGQLGGILLAEKKYAEAEPLLIAGYEGLKQRENKIPAYSKSRIKEALQRLAEFYETTGDSAKALAWKQKLQEFGTLKPDPQVTSVTSSAASNPPPAKSDGQARAN